MGSRGEIQSAEGPGSSFPLIITKIYMLFYDEFEFIVTPFFCTIIFGSLPELFPRSARIMDLESNLRTADMLIAQSFCQGVGVKNRIATLAPVLLISLTIWACSGSDATTDGHIRPVTRSTLSPVPVQLDTGVISAGDSIVVSVWDAPQFDTHTSVRFNGAITLPFVGEIEVAGNRKDELARMLRQRLSEYVKVTSRLPLRCSLLHPRSLSSAWSPGREVFPPIRAFPWWMHSSQRVAGPKLQICGISESRVNQRATLKVPHSNLISLPF